MEAEIQKHERMAQPDWDEYEGLGPTYKMNRNQLIGFIKDHDSK